MCNLRPIKESKKQMDYPGDKYYIEKVLNGNRRAYSFLLERYKDKVYSLALKICTNTEDAEEIAQDVFVKAFRALDGFKHKSSFSTWLYRICYNSSITLVRKRNDSILQLEDFPVDSVDFIRDSFDEEEAEKEYRKTLINFSMQKLNSTDRAIISLYYFQELSLEEISGIVKTSKSNLKVRMHRARKKMEGIIIGEQNKKVEVYEEIR